MLVDLMILYTCSRSSAGRSEAEVDQVLVDQMLYRRSGAGRSHAVGDQVLADLML